MAASTLTLTVQLNLVYWKLSMTARIVRGEKKSYESNFPKWTFTSCHKLYTYSTVS